MKKITYEAHIKELLKNKAARKEYEKLFPEYELARSIIEQRLKKKMTQEDIAARAGIPQSTVSRIEKLTHGLPKLATLKKIAKALDAKLIVKLDATDSRIIIEPMRKKKYPKGLDREFVAQVNDFIAKYKPALKELAKK